MHIMLAATLAVIVGLILLVISADRFTNNAAQIAEHYGMPKLIIGLTIVAFGTSAPEIIVSINAALADASNIALGNAMGSNLANTGLVLGVTAIVLPIVGFWKEIRVELFILLLLTALAGVLLLDLQLSQSDGWILLLALLLSTIIIMYIKIRSNDSTAIDIQHYDGNVRVLFLLFTTYLLLLIGSANLLVWGARELATLFGISELVIGLTIVAIGTSLPELAASLACAIKGHHEIAIGNILGSNIFNITAVLGLAGTINPFTIEATALNRDFVAMLGVLLLLSALLLISKFKSNKHKISITRVSGLLLLVYYCAYNIMLINTQL